MDDLIKLAVDLAPALGTMVLGPAGGAAIGKVAEIAQKLFGSNDPAVIQAQMSADQVKADMFKSLLSSLAASDVAQNETNKAEAASSSLFVAGWRPFIGWVCGLGLAYQFLLWPFLTWFARIMGVEPPPVLDGNSLMSLLTGMLGLSASRSYEKLNGVDTSSVPVPSFKLPSLAALTGRK